MRRVNRIPPQLKDALCVIGIFNAVLAAIVVVSCLASCCSSCQQTCRRSGPIAFEKKDGIWWATISGPSIVVTTDGTKRDILELREGEARTYPVQSPKVIAELERGAAP